MQQKRVAFPEIHLSEKDMKFSRNIAVAQKLDSILKGTLRLTSPIDAFTLLLELQMRFHGFFPRLYSYLCELQPEVKNTPLEKELETLLPQFLQMYQTLRAEFADDIAALLDPALYSDNSDQGTVLLARVRSVLDELDASGKIQTSLTLGKTLLFLRELQILTTSALRSN